MTDKAIELNEIETAKLAENGKLVLFRRVDPQPILESGVWRWKPRAGWDVNVQHINGAMCPFGKPGEAIATSAGGVRVVAVDVQKLDALLSEDCAGWYWRVEVTG